MAQACSTAKSRLIAKCPGEEPKGILLAECAAIQFELFPIVLFVSMFQRNVPNHFQRSNSLALLVLKT